MTTGPDAHDEDTKALEAAFRRLLVPLTRLAVSKGVPYAAVDEWLRASFVKAAYQTHPELPPHRRASRVSAATGLHRREVQRLLAESDAPAVPAKSVAAEVFAHWRSDKKYLHPDGKARVLPRMGPAPSFESLAHEVTRDVHPRTLLEELIRLNLAQRDPGDDTVSLVRTGFVPSKDLARMAGFLADNVGDHLAGAVANVLGESPGHLDQAVFAEGLSEASMIEVHAMLRTHWKSLADQLVPALESLLERDVNLSLTEARHRVRVGLYHFQGPAPAPLPGQQASGAKPRRRALKPESSPTTPAARASKSAAKKTRGQS
jgi:Family of unknown function (DUF6502)